ncbi:hypothetical protein [Anderseniella sp. Alg231-50]|uniref:hypothetical protein n=1 Tax=Anderseniella sp. Alg231-50 TaxID=1922226 RepID=UPI00307B5AAB
MKPIGPTSAKFAYLDGAIISAQAIGQWALKSGFGDDNVRILSDDKGGVVTGDAIAQAVAELFPAGAEQVDHMILAFCGHGLTDDQVGAVSWLMTDTFENKYRIKADAFYDEIMRHGIERLTVISDACREAPVDFDMTRWEGRRGIAVHGEKVDFPKIDLLMSCQDGMLGYMVGDPTTALPGKCVFSGVVSDVLWGREPDAIKDGEITVAGFGSYVRKRTHQRAKGYKLDLRPEVSVDPETAIIYDADSPPEGLPPHHPWPDVATATNLGPEDGTRGREPRDAVRGLVENDQFRRAMERVGSDAINSISPTLEGIELIPEPIQNTIREIVDLKTAQPDGPLLDDTAKTREAHIQHRVSQLETAAYQMERQSEATRMRRSLSQVDTTSAGLNLHIMDPKARIWSLGEEVTMDDGTRARASFSVPPNPSGRPLLIEFSDGYFAPFVPYEQSVAVVRRDEQGRVFQVYGSRADQEAFRTTLEMISKYAEGKLGPEDLQSVGAILRSGKSADPTRGVLSAYLYQVLADTASVQRTAFFYAQVGQPVPYDIVLLGDMAVTDDGTGQLSVEIPAVRARPDHGQSELPDYVTQATNATTAAVGGRCPWIGLGWDYVNLVREIAQPLISDLEEISRRVRRDGFTLLTREDGRRLADVWGLSSPQE